MQQQLGISPCVLLSEMNDRGITAACEVDVGNAVTMHALQAGLGRRRRPASTGTTTTATTTTSASSSTADRCRRAMMTDPGQDRPTTPSWPTRSARAALRLQRRPDQIRRVHLRQHDDRGDGGLSSTSAKANSPPIRFRMTSSAAPVWRRSRTCRMC